MRPSLSQVPFLAAIVLILLYLGAIVLRKLWIQGHTTTVHRLSLGLLLAWICCVLVVTLPRIDSQPGPPAFQIIPFSGEDRSTTETLANVLMFSPGGMLLAILLRRLSAWRPTAIFSILFSLCIEIAQALMRGGRSADSTDVVLNTVGAVIGHVACMAWVKNWPKKTRTPMDLVH